MPFEMPLSSMLPKAESTDRPKRPPVITRTPARQRAYFLRQFERCASVTEAAARTGITARTVQRWRQNDPRFARRYDETLARRWELLEDDGVRRARLPNVRPYFYKGRQIASIESYNDRLLMYMLTRLDRAEQQRASAKQLTEIAQATAAKLVETLRSGS